jgi:hypothetical protein
LSLKRPQISAIKQKKISGAIATTLATQPPHSELVKPWRPHVLNVHCVSSF